MSCAVPRLAAVAALSLVWTLAPASADDKAKDETPSEKIRKALDQPIDLELKESSMAKGVERFREKTRLDITIDRTALVVSASGERIVPEGGYPVAGKFKGTKVRDALRKAFEPYSLVPFVVDDAVLLTSEDVGQQKQLKQRVDVDVTDVPLAAALKQLGRRKAVNLVVDQKATKQAEKKVSLQVDDVAMETAVRLLAEQAGLKAARIDNVLYVTTPEQAASIAAENRANTPPTYWPYGPYGTFTGMPGGVGVIGAIGLGGAVGGSGLGGLGGGLGGIGGFGGIGGLGGLGGGVGIMGGPPRLLPPPPPPKEESKPAPPTSKAAPKAPAVAAADRTAVPLAPRPDLWARPTTRSTVGARRARRRVPFSRA